MPPFQNLKKRGQSSGSESGLHCGDKPKLAFGARKLPLMLRRNQVMELLGLPSTMINTLMKAGRFPLPVQLSPRTTVWLTTDIEKWVADKATEKVA